MMVTLAGLVLSSALFRKETRGHHLRTDHPEMEENARHVFLSKKEGLTFGTVKRISG